MGLFEHVGESLPDAMAHTNRTMSEQLGLDAEHEVLDVGCGYGGLARYLARQYGSSVLATNISDKELEWGRELTRKAGLADRVTFEWADFHELPYAADRFSVYWSQEAFLHAADKRRVLKPGGRLVFSELLVREGTPDADRRRIYERVGATEIWDDSDYERALLELGFTIRRHEDWSPNVALSYGWVRSELERRRPEFEQHVGREVVDATSQALQFWVDQANAGRIGWVYYVAEK